MASSSSNSSSFTRNLSTKYDAFLSFRGLDTRNKFTAHLKAALCEKGIKTFTDDENMKIGEYVSPQLIQAIENSRCLIIILSPRYPSSKWCLIELVKILDCMKNRGQIVLPVFYGVERCNVENQTGDFGKAFERREEDSEVETWRKALAEVAKLPGFELQDGYVYLLLFLYLS